MKKFSSKKDPFFFFRQYGAAEEKRLPSAESLLPGRELLKGKEKKFFNRIGKKNRLVIFGAKVLG